MKALKVAPLPLAIALLAGQGVQAQTNTNLFPLSFKAVCTSTNSSGGLFRELVGNANLIDDCAVEHNITNLTGLSLVFNRTNFSIQVLDTNGAPLCTSFSFSGGLAFTNTNSTAIVFQRDVFVRTNTTATGVISGSASWNNTNLAASYGLRADLLYIEPAAGTNAPSICRAELRVGAALNNEEGGEENEPPHEPGNRGNNGNGNQGNNGNHFGWQNPHNPHSGH